MSRNEWKLTFERRLFDGFEKVTGFRIPGTSGRAILLWDARSGKPRAALENAHGGSATKIYAVRFGRGGAFLASAGTDRNVKLWDATRSGFRERAAPLGCRRSPSAAHALALLGENLLASGHYDGAARVWDARSPDVAQELRPPPGVAPSPIAGIAADDGRGVGRPRGTSGRRKTDLRCPRPFGRPPGTTGEGVPDEFRSGTLAPRVSRILLVGRRRVLPGSRVPRLRRCGIPPLLLGYPKNSSKFSFRRQIELVSRSFSDCSSSLPEFSTTEEGAPRLSFNSSHAGR